MYNALKWGGCVCWLVDGCVGHGSVSFRLPLLVYHSIPFSMNRWVGSRGREGEVSSRSRCL